MDKKALLLSCVGMLIFDVLMLIGIAVAGTPEVKNDIQTFLVVLGITDVFGVALLYGAMTWD